MGEVAESAYIFDRHLDESKRSSSALLRRLYLANGRSVIDFTNLVNNELIHPSIPRHSLITIADVATGTGLWITSLPDYLRSVNNHSSSLTLHGFDISADQFPSTEKTVAPGYEIEFLVHDIRNRFPEQYRGKYDLVNVSLLVAALREEEYEASVRNLLEILRPNGYLQWTETDSSTLGRIQLPSLELKTISNIVVLTNEGMSHVGFCLNPPHKIQHVAKKVGFARVETHTYSVLDRADLRGQAREWLGTIWRTTIPHVMVQSGRVGSMQEAWEKMEEWIKEVEKEYDMFWPTVDLRVIVARKGVKV
ncbi:putative LaeA-like methyltransferase [Aspergillus melleus]|uniref:putative LaeA-like methyltransferase n=1 Tax=Aspergillus melleus TaxID=138277 RepID=UPI001E8E5395|nr:uncharacterized protein LDX57_005376 [Aspergillus melleus]KAH8427665.1 hypothetical protein LDX57_005376 [Aspergillus melleus]